MQVTWKHKNVGSLEKSPKQPPSQSTQTKRGAGKGSPPPKFLRFLPHGKMRRENSAEALFHQQCTKVQGENWKAKDLSSQACRSTGREQTKTPPRVHPFHLRIIRTHPVLSSSLSLTSFYWMETCYHHHGILSFCQDTKPGTISCITPELKSSCFTSSRLRHLKALEINSHILQSSSRAWLGKWRILWIPYSWWRWRGSIPTLGSHGSILCLWGDVPRVFHSWDR